MLKDIYRQKDLFNKQKVQSKNSKKKTFYFLIFTFYLMVTIHLHNVIIFAHHGIYDEEKINGNTFEINLDVVYNNKKSEFENIEHTISYEDLFTIVKSEMQTATPLLEKVCSEIINKIKSHHPAVKKIKITMYKLNAPIQDFKGKAGVTIEKKFDY